ncbi:hypothetical protein ILYODFUR_035599 [Ilyodon furcidens]|uniref:Chitin synthase n=1 Tax=Ilyodon furcidens TaxID=33524 RepID=A0ABV0UY08_9TELE
MKSRTKPCTYLKTIGLTISAYQEDPKYLRECLTSVKGLKYPPELLRIVMMIDENTDNDRYMMNMFREVFEDQDMGLYVWRNNYHSWISPQVQGNMEMDTVSGPGVSASCRSV